MAETTKKKILVVDDHPVFREGIVGVLASEPDFEVCGAAGSVREALTLIGKTEPDLVISDMTLPDRNGLELIKDIKALHLKVPVLVISMHDENIYSERVLRAGGRGYIMKEAPIGEITDAIRQILAGGVYVSRAASSRFLEEMTHHDQTPKFSFPLQRLSDRELEVFELVGQGKSPQEIGKQLGISPRTVDAHRGHIRKKLRISDGNALISYAAKYHESGEIG